jgi:hypothetical protein
LSTSAELRYRAAYSLGQIDSSRYGNGMYQIGLFVTDVNGAQSSASVTVEFLRNLKLGQFRLSFSDIRVDALGIGRRNWLFADTVAGANASANLYSLLQTCKANGIDGYAYLRRLLIALPKASTADDYEALLPTSPRADHITRAPARTWSIDRLQITSVTLSVEEHAVYTARWLQAVARRRMLAFRSNWTAAEIVEAARESVYFDAPALMNALERMLLP